MLNQTAECIDLIQEFRLRRWARDNYVALRQRDPQWHQVVLEEMQAMDVDRLQQLDTTVDLIPGTSQRLDHRPVPAAPMVGLRLHIEECDTMAEPA